jgi:hypothetical protein
MDRKTANPASVIASVSPAALPSLSLQVSASGHAQAVFLSDVLLSVEVTS